MLHNSRLVRRPKSLQTDVVAARVSDTTGHAARLLSELAGNLLAVRSYRNLLCVWRCLCGYADVVDVC